MASGNPTVGPGPGFGGNMQNGPTGWLAAFSSTGFEGELPLLEGWTLLILLLLDAENPLRTRARDQLLPYLDKVDDSSQPSSTNRRTNNGRRRHGRSGRFLLCLWDVPSPGTSSLATLTRHSPHFRSPVDRSSVPSTVSHSWVQDPSTRYST